MRPNPKPKIQNPKSKITLVLLTLALTIFAACRDSDSSAAAQPLTQELREVMEQVAAVRSLPPAENVRAATVSRGDVAEVIAEALTDDDRDAMKRLTTLYRLLGHLQPDEDFLGVYREFTSGAVIGFYDPAKKEFFVVSNESEIDFDSFTRQQKSTTAHEFVHALQDASFDLLALSKRTRDDLDWSLALTAVIEGDAVVHEGLWSREHALAPEPDGEPLLAHPFLSTVPASIEREFRFPYTVGPEWVGIVRSTRGNAAIDGILKGRRITTAEILHPELYDSNWEPEEVVLPDIAQALGKGWEHESGGGFGEFQLRNYLQLELGALASVSAAGGWAGDRYDVYADGEESVAGIRLAFTSDAEAAEFVAAQDDWFEAGDARITKALATTAEFGDGRTFIRTQPTGTEVLLVIGSNRATAEKAARLLAGG